MKLMTTTGLALLVTAAPLMAQSSIDEVAAQLKAEGYADIEVEVFDDVIEIEGYRAGQERELIFDAATWELLKDETHADLEADDDDDDEDHDDHDDDTDDDHSDDDDDHDDDDHDDDDDDDDEEGDDD